MRDRFMDVEAEESGEEDSPSHTIDDVGSSPRNDSLLCSEDIDIDSFINDNGDSDDSSDGNEPQFRFRLPERSRPVETTTRPDTGTDSFSRSGTGRVVIEIGDDGGSPDSGQDTGVGVEDETQAARPMDEVLEDDHYSKFGLKYTILSNSDDTMVTEGGYLTDKVFQVGKLNVVRAAMGCGKTQAAKTFVEKLTADNAPEGVKVLVICNRKSLSTLAATTFDADHYLVCRPYDSAPCQRYVICINSLAKLPVAQLDSYDVVIFDELSGTIGNVVSPLVAIRDKNQLLSIVKHLLNPNRRAGGNSRTVMVMDATLGDREMQLISSLADVDTYLNMTIYLPDVALHPLPAIVAEPHMKQHLIDIVNMAWFSNRKFLIATSGKDFVASLMKLIAIGSDKLAEFLGIRNRDDKRKVNILWFDADMDKTRMDNYLLNQDQMLQYDIVVYTPVLLSGVSVTVKGFYKLFVVACLGTVTASGLVQMMRRWRHIGEGGIQFSYFGKKVMFHGPLTREFLSQKLHDYKNIDHESRAIFSEALGARTSDLTNYFAAETPEYVMDVLAYTVAENLAIRTQPATAIDGACYRNHPQWKVEVIPRDPPKGRPLQSIDLCKILEAHASDWGNIVSTSMGNFLVTNPEKVEEKVATYLLCGHGKTLADTKVHGDFIKTSFSVINVYAVNCLANTVGTFGPYHYARAMGSRVVGAAPSTTHAVNVYRLIADLLVLFEWKNHYEPAGHMENSTVPMVWLLLDPTMLGDFSVTAELVYSRWMSLTRWSTRYAITLAQLGIHSIKPDLAVTPKLFTGMADIITKVFGVVGMTFETKTVIVKDNKRRVRGSSIKRDAIALYGERDDMMQQTPLSLTKLLTQYRFDLDQPKFLIQWDVATRYDIRNLCSFVSVNGVQVPEFQQPARHTMEPKVAELVFALAKVSAGAFATEVLLPSWWLDFNTKPAAQQRFMGRLMNNRWHVQQLLSLPITFPANGDPMEDE